MDFRLIPTEPCPFLATVVFFYCTEETDEKLLWVLVEFDDKKEFKKYLN